MTKCSWNPLHPSLLGALYLTFHLWHCSETLNIHICYTHLPILCNNLVLSEDELNTVLRKHFVFLRNIHFLKKNNIIFGWNAATVLANRNESQYTFWLGLWSPNCPITIWYFWIHHTFDPVRSQCWLQRKNVIFHTKSDNIYFVLHMLFAAVIALYFHTLKQWLTNWGPRGSASWCLGFAKKKNK